MGDSCQICGLIHTLCLFKSRDCFGPLPFKLVAAGDVQVCTGERRIQFQNALALLDRLGSLMSVGVYPCQVHGAKNIERIQIEGASVFCQGLIESLPHLEVERIIQVIRGVVGVQLDGMPELPFRPGPIPVVPKLDSGKIAMPLRKVGIELKSLLDGCARLRRHLRGVCRTNVGTQRCVTTR